MSPAPLKVLVVDDSAVVRRMLRDVLDAEPGLEVVGEAEDPFAAHEAIFSLRPDVITLDIEMPKMDGLTFLGKLMQHHPLPVVVHSSLTPANSPQAIAALSLGAIDAVPKPRSAKERDACMARLVRSVRAAAGSRPRESASLPTESPVRDPAGRSPIETGVLAIGVAASTGGTQALESLFARLPPTLPCILVVQHLPGEFVDSFTARIDRRSPLSVRVAVDGEPLRHGTALVAPGDRHLTLSGTGAAARVRIVEGPRVNFHRPSADILFRGLARSCGASGIGIVLTGMGSDGAAGLLEMRTAGAHTMAQSRESSVVYGMPRAAAENGAAAEIVELDDVPRRLEHVLGATSATHAC